MSLRVLVLADASVPHAIRWCRKLIELGVETALFSLESPDLEPDFRFYHASGAPAPFHRFRYLLSVPQLNRVIEDFRPNVLNPHFIPNYGLMAVMARHNLPIYLSVWGSDLLVVPRSSGLKGAITGSILRKAHGIHVDAFLMAEILVQQFKLPGYLIDIFPFGVDDVFLKREVRFILPENGMWTVVSHRRLDPDMSPMTVLMAAERLKEQPVRFVMASDGSLRPELERYAAQKGLNVRFTGRLPLNELVELLSSAQIWVSASLTDSTPVSLLEAMALGLFPVVSNLPAVREWVIDGANGLLFWPDDPDGLAKAILQAIQTPELLQHAVQFNRKIVERKANLRKNMEKMLVKWKNLASQNSLHERKL